MRERNLVHKIALFCICQESFGGGTNILFIACSRLLLHLQCEMQRTIRLSFFPEKRNSIREIVMCAHESNFPLLATVPSEQKISPVACIEKNYCILGCFISVHKTNRHSITKYNIEQMLPGTFSKCSDINTFPIKYSSANPFSVY